MMRAFLTILMACMCALPASAQWHERGPCDGVPETACMLDSIWAAVELLPPQKQDRVKGVFLQTVALTNDPALTRQWTGKLGAPDQTALTPVPYARQRAEAALAQGGWDSFLQLARAGKAPFNVGRPEVMAAGARLAKDSATRQRIIQAMFDIAGPPQPRNGLGGSFEQADFGHALAEIAMETCELQMFDRAVALTAAPESLRYALWRTRITGNAGGLAARIRNEADESDTRHVRNALEGYAPVLSLGYCHLDATPAH